MQVTDAMVAKAAQSDAEFDGRTWLAMPKSERERYLERSRRSLTAALAEMWRTDFENAPFMEAVALALRDRQLPIAVFRHNAESPWRYLESGREVEDELVATHFMPLPVPPPMGE